MLLFKKCLQPNCTARYVYTEKKLENTLKRVYIRVPHVNFHNCYFRD